MFSRIQTIKSTESFSDNIKRLQDALCSADAVVIGAGAGLSAAAGFDYGGERFHKYFADFEEKYGIHDMYSGGFYPYDSGEEYWSWWSRHILINRYDCPVGEVYKNLLSLIKTACFTHRATMDCFNAVRPAVWKLLITKRSSNKW